VSERRLNVAADGPDPVPDAETDADTEIDEDTETAADEGPPTGTATTASDPDAPTVVAFVCVENAGRSQMAAAFARRELARRGVDDRIAVTSGGTEPADRVHESVVAAMAEVGIDLSGQRPSEIGREELLAADVVVTMGCSAEDVCPATWRGDARDWGLEDPAGKPPETVAAIRDEIDRRVATLVDDLTGDSGVTDGV
jgi:protein-tyrosine-phosphatase